MDAVHDYDRNPKKMTPPSTRPFTTALFLLRCTSLGLSMADLDLLDMGMVIDMFVEQGNDDYDWPVKATAKDIEAF